jgi:non-specific serine/threonine protein kinase
MLEPVRQYARELLEKSAEAERVRERHAEHYLALAEKAEPELMGARQAEWLERLKVEHGNLGAALQWSLVEGEHGELGLRLAGALERFWWVGGHLSEGRRWLERGLAGGSTLPTSVRAKALSEAGWMALYQNDLERAVTLLEESVSLSKDLGDEPSIATSLFNLGHAVLHQGDKERLEALCEEAEALRWGTFVDRWAIAELVVFLGMAALYEGDHERAAALLEESMVSFREMGDMQRVTLCITHLWMAELEGGDRERAAALVEENLRLLQRLGIKPRIYNDLLGSAVLAALDGRPARATRLWGAAEALRESIGLAIVLWDHVPTDYEGQLAAARSRLGEEAFVVAWEEGKVMTPEEAIAYALDETPPLGDPAQPRTAAAPRRPAPSAGQPLPVALTGRELEVLELIVEGLSNGQIAARLFIEVSTVKSYVNRIFKKLGVESRTQAVAQARKLHLLSRE